MAINFPNSPTVGQIHVSGANSWQYNGTSWNSYTDNIPGPVGPQGPVGPVGVSIEITDQPPSNPVAGDLWWDSASGSLRLYYVDGTSDQWVDAINVEGPQGPQGLEGTPGQGIASGGTIGQALVKTSNANYATGWVDFFTGKYSITSTEYLSGTGTFTPDAGAKFFQVICVGGGGGGGGADGDGSAAACSGGGGGGGTSIRWYSTVEMGTSATYTVGAAGTAGNGATGAAGGTGGISTFVTQGSGATLVSSGGSGGTGTGSAFAAVSGAFAGGAGGSGGSGGHVNINGEPGFDGWGDGLIYTIAGGGNSYYGGAPKNQIFASNINGSGAPGIKPGAGGAGGASVTLTTGVTSGAGASGSILILQYI